MLDQIHPHAAGIDVGATRIFVALPGEPPCCFETFTAEEAEGKSGGW